MKRKRIIKINKKGHFTLWFLALGVLFFAASLLFYMNKMENKLGNIGESTVKIMNSFEMSERLFFYLDASVEISARKAAQEVIKNSGYSKKTFKGKIDNPGCGMLGAPVIDANKSISECFPDYEEAFQIQFLRQNNKLLLKYNPFELDPTDFTTTTKKESNYINVRYSSQSNLDLPVYSYIESYYASADKTRTNAVNINEVTTTEEGYYTSRKYLSLTSFQRSGAVTKIVIHDTGTDSVDKTYEELSTGLKNYHYIIDKEGKITQLTPEDKYTLHADCEKGFTGGTCTLENVDVESISIALVNKIPSQTHTTKQIDALKRLIAQISLRNPLMEINAESILLNNEIDTSRIDPAPDLKTQKAKIISDAQAIKESLIPSAPVPAPPGGNQVTNNAILDITGKATEPPDNIEDLKCIQNVVTTKYFTPSCADYTWTTGVLPCPDNRGYCCKSNRGFFEEVKCQGSGVCEGKTYYHETISAQGIYQSTPLDPKYTNGVTATGTNPMPKRTVAADTNCFKKGTKLYIYWSENSDWNGYYTVEDVGSAIKTCNHLDIYVGVGDEALKNANFESTNKDPKGNDYAKVCVLDENFEMPDPEFYEGSGYTDAVTGSFSAKYNHNVKVYNFTTLFDATKNFFEATINGCKQTPNDQKDACIEGKMATARTTTPNLNIERCDIEAYQGINLIQEAPIIMGAQPIDAEIKILAQIIDYPDVQTDSGEPENYVELPQNNPENPEFNLLEIVLFPELTGNPVSASIKVKDDSGEMTINLTRDALAWVNYSDLDSELMRTNSMLKKGDNVLLIVKYNSSLNVYYIDNFSDISPNPEDVEEQEFLGIIKTLGECITSENTCECTTSAARILKEIKFENGTFTNINTNEDLIVDFTSSQNLQINTSQQHIYKITRDALGTTVALTDVDEPEVSACAPQKTYKYICSSLAGDEDLGTLKYALKI